MLLTGIVERIELGNKYGRIIALSQLTDKLFVAVAIDRTQMKIAMSHSKREPCRMHEMCQHHRVHTTTNSKQHLLPRREEMLLLNVGYESV